VLMTSTFRNIRKGEGALAAMSDAQRDMLSGSYSNGPYHFSRSNPFFWAPFVYVGD
jgi:CHAT domain-containing protein